MLNKPVQNVQGCLWETEDTGSIESFHGEWAVLSNFFPSEVQFEGRFFPTVEHAYQAAKTLNEDERDAIQGAATPGRAKRLGAKVSLRADWDDIKVDVMRDLLRQKFGLASGFGTGFEDDDRGQSLLATVLLATGSRELVEGNTWGDRFWGVVFVDGVRGTGLNWLGRLLMEIRDELAKISI